MITLRPYQADIVDRTRESLRAHKSVLIQLPTGGGKTALAAKMLGTARERGRTAWFIAHRDFLLEQTSRTFRDIGIPHAFIAAGRFRCSVEPVQICSVQTLVRRLARLQAPDMVVWDECHHVAAGTYKAVREFTQRSLHVGLSATPCRLDGKGLDGYFEHMVQGPTVGELMEDGYLSQYRAYAPSTPDVSGIRTIAGDFNAGQLGDVLDTNEIVGDLVRHYRQHADGLRAVYFAVSVAHSQHIAATFRANGIPAAHLDGNSTSGERVAAARDIAAGRLRVLVNVDLMSEGFDLAAMAGDPRATVDCVGLARPTKSLSLHMQQIGRALRPKPQPAVILDHAGNLARLGLPDEPREWSLSGVDRTSRAGAARIPIRTCASCFGVYPAGRDACPYCGTVHEVEGRQVEEVAGSLAEVDREAVRARWTPDQFVRRKEEWQCRSLADFAELGRQRGYKPGWAIARWEHRKKRA